MPLGSPGVINAKMVENQGFLLLRTLFSNLFALGLFAVSSSMTFARRRASRNTRKFAANDAEKLVTKPFHGP